MTCLLQYRPSTACTSSRTLRQQRTGRAYAHIVHASKGFGSDAPPASPAQEPAAAAPAEDSAIEALEARMVSGDNCIPQNPRQRSLHSQHL